VELLVTFALISCALALLVGLVAQCNRWFRLASARNLAQQQLLAVGTRLAQDLRQTAFSGVTAVAPAPDSLALAFPTCYDPKGQYCVDDLQQPEYQSYQVFFRRPSDGTLRVLRTTLGETFPMSDALAPLPTSVTAALTQDSQALARFIKSFSLVGSLDNPLSFKLIVETAVEGSQEKKILEVTSTIRIPR